MKFEDYQRLHNCIPLGKTEQNRTFVVNVNGERRVVKRYPAEFDRLREELAYAYINSFGLLNVPKLISSGEDFIEMELLESFGTLSIDKIIRGVFGMYIKTINDSKPKRYFPRIDLTKSKLLRRLEYIPTELEKRGMIDKNLFERSEHFINERYIAPEHFCLVHGDLKSPNIIETEKGAFFIDLALISVANPWYDLAFLYMKRRNKKNFLNELGDKSFEFLGRDFSVSKENIRDFLQSAIFYRCLYDVVFAARHKADKILKRTICDLSEIMEH